MRSHSITSTSSLGGRPWTCRLCGRAHYLKTRTTSTPSEEATCTLLCQRPGFSTPFCLVLGSSVRLVHSSIHLKSGTAHLLKGSSLEFLGRIKGRLDF